MTEYGKGNVRALLHNIISAPIVPKDHAHVGKGEACVISALLQREPDARLGSRAGGGHLAIFEHPWFEAMRAQDVIMKRLTPPWLPAGVPIALM